MRSPSLQPRVRIAATYLSVIFSSDTGASHLDWRKAIAEFGTRNSEWICGSSIRTPHSQIRNVLRAVKSFCPVVRSRFPQRAPWLPLIHEN